MSNELAKVDDALATAIEKIGQREVSYEDLLKLLAPPSPAPTGRAVPLPRKITDEQRKALDRLPEVYGKVVPEERRMLEASEVDSLLEEKGVLKTVESLIKDRTNDVRSIILNHNDVAYEESTPEEERIAQKEKDGHWVVKGSVDGTPGEVFRFSAEPRGGTAGIDPELIRALADNPEEDWLTHQDYLDCTESVRILDQNKLMLLIKRKPDLVRLFRDASVPGTPSIAVQPRKV